MSINKVAIIGCNDLATDVSVDMLRHGISVLLLAEDIGVKKALYLDIAKEKGVVIDAIDIEFIDFNHSKQVLDKLRDVDWIIDMEVEDLRKNLIFYDSIYPYIKNNVIISFNTSTVSLKFICNIISKKIINNIIIVHFFNFSYKSNILEVVLHKDNSIFLIELLKDFCDTKLGKEVIICNDTPGLIGDRITCFFIIAAIVKSMSFNISIEAVDEIIANSSRDNWILSGIFNLLDVIGIDKFLFIADNIVKKLPQEDLLHVMFHQLPRNIFHMVNDGCTGVKTVLGGFYRKYEVRDGLMTQVIDIKSGLYRSQKPFLESNFLCEKGKIIDLLESNSVYGKFYYSLWSEVLLYIASIASKIANKIADIDDVMRFGCNWKFGPFYLIDLLNSLPKKWLINKLNSDKINIPQMLTFNKKMYQDNQYMGFTGDYYKKDTVKDLGFLSDMIGNSEVIIKNDAASLWDIGDGVVCFEFNTKYNVLNYNSFCLLYESLNIVDKNFKCMVIGNDAIDFSRGTDLLYLKNNYNNIIEIGNFIEYAQKVLTKLKFSNFPIVAAISGLSAGSACDLFLHCDAVQVHIDSINSLLEIESNILSGCGGYKEMILRYLYCKKSFADLLNLIIKSKVLKSVKQMYESQILREKDKMTINRKKLLADAKNKALSLRVNYTPPVMISNIEFPEISYDMQSMDFSKVIIIEKLINIFKHNSLKTEMDLLKLEKALLLELLAING